LAPSVWNIHIVKLLVSQVFIVLSEFKLHYSCICCCLSNGTNLQ